MRLHSEGAVAAIDLRPVSGYIARMWKQRWRDGRSGGARGLIAFACLLTAVAGCSGAEPSQPDLAPEPPDLSPPPYPPAPYGANVGDTLPNFIFQGYFSPTATTGLASSQPFGDVTFDQLRMSGAKFALLHLAAFW